MYHAMSLFCQLSFATVTFSIITVILTTSPFEFTNPVMQQVFAYHQRLPVRLLCFDRVWSWLILNVAGNFFSPYTRALGTASPVSSPDAAPTPEGHRLRRAA